MAEVPTIREGDWAGVNRSVRKLASLIKRQSDSAIDSAITSTAKVLSDATSEVKSAVASVEDIISDAVLSLNSRCDSIETRMLSVTSDMTVSINVMVDSAITSIAKVLSDATSTAQSGVDSLESLAIVAYIHAIDNIQAHSDYLRNNVDDTTTHTLTAAGFTTNGAVEAKNLTVGNSVTFDWGDPYKMAQRGLNTIYIQNTDDDRPATFEIYTAKGDGGDNAAINIWLKGLPGSTTDREIFQIIADNTSEMKINTQASGTGVVRPLILYTGANTNQLKLNTDGSLLAAPTYSVAVGGTNRDLYIDDTGLIGYNSSSLMYKHNIRNLDDSSRIHQLRPVKFDRINSTDEAGLIAEEVDDVMPEIVSNKRNKIMGKKWDEIAGEEVDVIAGYETTDIPETVNYSRLIVPLLKEVQKLRQEIDELKLG